MARGWLYPWAMGSVAFGGASLLVPLYVVELGGDAFDLGLLAAVAAFVGVPAAVLVGRWADRSGRRRSYVLAALSLTAAVLAVVPFVESITLVILVNGAVWLAFAAAMPVVTLLAVTDTPAHAWGERIALLSKYQGVGWAIGLALGVVWLAVTEAFLEPGLALRTCFGALAAVAVAGALTGVWTFPRDRPGEPISGVRLRTVLRRNPSQNVRSGTFPLTVPRADFGGFDPRRFIARFTPALALYFLAIVAMFTGFAAFFAPLPAFLTDIGYSSDEIFGLYLISSLGSVVCFGAVGRLVSSVNVTVVQAAGLVLRGVAIPAVAIVGLALGTGVLGFAALIGIFAVIGISWAVITVTAGTIVTALSPVVIRGEALGVYAALTALAGGIGALLGGYLGAADFIVAFVTAGTLIVLGAAIVFSLRRTRDEGQDHGD